MIVSSILSVGHLGFFFFFFFISEEPDPYILGLIFSCALEFFLSKVHCFHFLKIINDAHILCYYFFFLEVNYSVWNN